MTAVCKHLPRLQKSRIADQHSALTRSKAQTRLGKAHSDCCAQIGDQMLGMSAIRRPSEGVCRQPRQHSKGNEAANKGRFPGYNKRLLDQEIDARSSSQFPSADIGPDRPSNDQIGASGIGITAWALDGLDRRSPSAHKPPSLGKGKPCRDYRLDEIEQPERHPDAAARPTGQRRRRSLVNQSGGELPSRKVDARSFTGLTRHSQASEQCNLRQRQISSGICCLDAAVGQSAVFL